MKNTTRYMKMKPKQSKKAKTLILWRFWLGKNLNSSANTAGVGLKMCLVTMRPPAQVMILCGRMNSTRQKDKNNER